MSYHPFCKYLLLLELSIVVVMLLVQDLSQMIGQLSVVWTRRQQSCQ